MTEHVDAPPETLVGISFPDVFRAQEFLTAATRMASRGELQLKDAVTVVKDADGKTAVRETIDPQPLPSAMSGALWAGLIGLIVGGPVGWAAGLAVGAGAGAATAKLVDLGLADEWVSWFRDVVQPETATVALLVTELDHEALLAEAARFAGAELVYTNLDPTTMDRLKAALGEHAESPAAGTDTAVEPTPEPVTPEPVTSAPPETAPPATAPPDTAPGD